ncbi:MAG: methionyl-tRNA formyltransferase [Patiriisocius sp.]|jgi:methionyl-tRNA formyltransferase
MEKTTENNINFAYFGGEPIGVPVLNELEACGLVPSLVVCNPDRPVGRKQVLTAPASKTWALERNIPVFQPETLKDKKELATLTENSFDLFVVVAYNKIMPKWLIDAPTHGTLNVHPSLLPLLRGASPIRSTILQDLREQCGVSIMQMDEKMDHGPILAQQVMDIEEAQWPIGGNELDIALANTGGALLASVIPQWIAGDIDPQEQDHEQATFCGKMEKADGEINLEDDGYANYLKFCAYEGFPGTFFFIEKNEKQVRVKIVSAELNGDGIFVPLRVTPEGKKEMDYEAFEG